MLTVRQLLAGKPTNHIFAMRPEQSVIEALELMSEKNIGCIMIMEQTQLVGIFSERDYARKGIIKGRKAKTTPLKEVMTSGVYVVTTHDSIDDCMKMMSTKHIRHLPVVEDQRVVGILSISDIVTAIMNDQKNRIQSLEQYITSY
jgi:CBS domain-containing protein